MKEKMTYTGVGVKYDAMDPFKRMAQLIARETARNIVRLGFSDLEASRGESAYLVEANDRYLAHVEEGLGTKNLVADEMYRLTGKSYYSHVAQDTVAMIVNDMITLGALPISVAMHLAVGSSDWFENGERWTDLLDGWKNACNLARCVFGGGETPTLKGIVNPGTVVLAGSAMGIIKPKERLISPEKIQDGDSIVLINSSGIHANGLTMARKVAEGKDSFWRKLGYLFLPKYFSLRALPHGYLTRLDDGRTYGETLLNPTHIYVGLVEDCLNSGVDIHYAVNITGHGWRKLMRANQPFAYIIEALPEQQPIFDFIQKHGPVEDKEAYGNLNMGAGFALYVPESDVPKMWHILRSYEPFCFGAVKAGYIEQSDEKKVVIRPKGLEYLGSTLGVR